MALLFVQWQLTYQSSSSEHNPYPVFAFPKELKNPVVSHSHLGTDCQGLDMGTNELPTKSEQLYSVLRRREFGLICITSESCLGSIVGLPARVLATLRSTLSARVVKGELLRCASGSSGQASR